MQRYNGIIHKVEQMKGGAHKITIIRAEHINPPAVQATFLVEDAPLVEFFSGNIGWPVYGSIDSAGYMGTCSHDW
jgi:hypothetical protein